MPSSFHMVRPTVSKIRHGSLEYCNVFGKPLFLSCMEADDLVLKSGEMAAFYSRSLRFLHSQHGRCFEGCSSVWLLKPKSLIVEECLHSKIQTFFMCSPSRYVILTALLSYPRPRDESWTSHFSAKDDPTSEAMTFSPPARGL